MIAKLTGQLITKSPTTIILDVQGVGYEIFIPLSTYFALPDLQAALSLNILTHVREDAIQLFGFLTIPEKEAFVMLTGISGVGGKLALSVLSTLSVSDLITAIQTDDTDKLASVPGIGKKSASRMALELKDKVARLNPDSAVPTQATLPDQIQDDAVSALVNLGYRPRDVKDMVTKISRDQPNSLPLDDLIREALKQLSKH
ncbi:Holliday junction branch migration protein RuvA [Candidatus Nitronereus thalassa]|uniref:Holliday junction branch migration complex subunit RuvA n=1 Tax=Candidatus Nitronereus thalassa TaxID=3020898 RepID=A0ABU3K8C8_9BACT|nr:Holliday junction branch migration protein RuvA [Candidatus Nitronereus thalassa]MDT7042646.1 Holliday junction branch migration protein RuvA [Candidatus Nitronereus thalassa]